MPNSFEKQLCVQKLVSLSKRICRANNYFHSIFPKLFISQLLEKQSSFRI